MNNCNYCDNKDSISLALLADKAVFIENTNLVIEDFDLSYKLIDSLSIPIKYCPICGRSLYE